MGRRTLLLDLPLWLQRPNWARELYPNCVAWVDATRRVWSDTSGLIAATNGDAVNRWSDAAHGSITWDQATDANAPVWQTGTILYPLPALTFDASNDELASSANPIANSDNFTVFSVGIKGASGPRQTRGGTGLDFSVSCTPNGFSVVLTSGGAAQYDAVNALYTTGQRFVTCHWLTQGSEMRLYQGSVGLVTTTATPKTTLRNSATTWLLGRFDTTFEAGSWSEVIIYNRALAKWELDEIMRTLTRKWIR